MEADLLSGDQTLARGIDDMRLKGMGAAIQANQPELSPIQLISSFLQCTIDQDLQSVPLLQCRRKAQAHIDHTLVVANRDILLGFDNLKAGVAFRFLLFAL
ncbi:hypothetical protein [endosymbiont of Riftia pachyptila]|uniref:hypothetical protein n=1 Tax=endosymbiont of Riftia pachyptila TaxID=54396 RepID=UPI0005873384|nr:hypothetical protein [endosymbiont of Riftia pachyptila]